jgi:diguanylate cyclase (GGDEF)-like protein
LRDALGGAGVLARWGGEEFAVLFERVPFARAHQICEAMRLRVAALDCSSYAPGWHITISGGVTARDTAARPEDLVARADALLYQAKQTGRNRICS